MYGVAFDFLYLLKERDAEQENVDKSPESTSGLTA